MMKRILIFLMTAALLFSVTAAAETDITAQGTATVTADPDIVSIYCSADLRGATVAEVQARVSEVVAGATEKLLSLGVGEEDIVTNYYNFYPVYDYRDSETEPTQTGYQASHSLEVTCRDITRLDEIVEAMTQAGMTSVNDIRFDLSNRHDLYMEALSIAVGAAREKAEVLAAASGMRLGKVSEVRENGSGDAGYYANATEDAAMGSKRLAGTGIRSGSVSVTASVTVEFEAEK